MIYIIQFVGHLKVAVAFTKLCGDQWSTNKRYETKTHLSFGTAFVWKILFFLLANPNLNCKILLDLFVFSLTKWRVLISSPQIIVSSIRIIVSSIRIIISSLWIIISSLWIIVSSLLMVVLKRLWLIWKSLLIKLDPHIFIRYAKTSISLLEVIETFENVQANTPAIVVRGTYSIKIC